jgi:uncharacterized protein YgiM (DUF1202 family)
MKTNCWLILGMVLATTAVAQVNTNKLPAIPAPVIATPPPAAPAPMAVTAPTQTNAPAKKIVHAKKKTTKKAKTAAKTSVKKTPAAPVILVPGPATVAAEHVNLRGQAGLKGEVVGHVQKGDSVTVISEITLDKPKAGEPAQWAKIALPTGTKVWVDSKYIDPSNNVVTVKKLNLRGGPGENYSVLGVIEKGAPITVVVNKGDWTQIEPPTSAFAFLAASYLKQEASAVDTNVPTPPTVAATETVPPPPTIPPTTATVPEATPIAPPATTPPTTPETTAPVPPPTTAESVPPPTPAPSSVTPAMLPQPTLAPEDTNLPPPPPRIVTHEGSVRHSVSPVAPTEFELYDPTDNKAINYLYTTTTNLNLSRYKGLHITVTGEEGLDPRWQDTPVITIQKIYVLSDDKPAMSPVKKHWWSK